MAFVIEDNTVVSFAEFNDVLEKDTRIFEANEGLTDDVVDRALVRTTERILTKIRNTSWWRSYYLQRDLNLQYNTVADIPAVDPDKIAARQNDFTDLCVFTALTEIILPGIADFSDPDNSERQKMAYYQQRSDFLFDELIRAGDWYDFDNSGTITANEKQPGQINLKRVR